MIIKQTAYYYEDGGQKVELVTVPLVARLLLKEKHSINIRFNS